MEKTAKLPPYRPLHPFPARMAPEIALRILPSLPKGSIVLDPMCGSGTVLIQAIRQGHRAIGFDLDPLAILMSRVSTRHLDPEQIVKTADMLVDNAEKRLNEEIELPWIDDDRETLEFIEFWFGYRQCRHLRSLAWLVAPRRGPVWDVLKLAISKIIITKKPYASLAGDTSHSRPHRVIAASNYDVLQGFRKAVAQLANGMDSIPTGNQARVFRVDARRSFPRLRGQVDCVLTSPPYGNAIDYLRGHRLALVWLGYTIPNLRIIKNRTIGYAHNNVRTKPRNIAVQKFAQLLGPIVELDPSTHFRIISFVYDSRMVLKQIYRALKPNGHAVLVIGNSRIKGLYLNNARLVAAIAEQEGLQEIARYSREIPASHRYLPPPERNCDQALSKRMKEEVVITFKKSGT